MKTREADVKTMEADGFAVRRKTRGVEGHGLFGGRVLLSLHCGAAVEAGWGSCSVGVHDSCLHQRRARVCGGAGAGHVHRAGLVACLKLYSAERDILLSGGVKGWYRRAGPAPGTPALAFSVASDLKKRMLGSATGGIPLGGGWTLWGHTDGAEVLQGIDWACVK